LLEPAPQSGGALPLHSAVGREHLGRRWFVAVTLGELVGFAIPSIVGGAAWAFGAPPLLLYAALVCAGAGEGAVLGAAQWLVLREPLPSLSSLKWIGATAGAAAFAWSIGMLPSSLGEAFSDLPVLVLGPAVAAGGVAIFLSIGTAQAIVLRSHAGRTWRWVVANVLAWCAGLVVSVSLISILVTESTSVAGGIAIGAFAGLLMGATVALVTGWFLVRIVSGGSSRGTHPDPSSRPRVEARIRESPDGPSQAARDTRSSVEHGVSVGRNSFEKL
jgi:hypothetical protein